MPLLCGRGKIPSPLVEEESGRPSRRPSVSQGVWWVVVMFSPEELHYVPRTRTSTTLVNSSISAGRQAAVGENEHQHRNRDDLQPPRTMWRHRRHRSNTISATPTRKPPNTAPTTESMPPMMMALKRRRPRRQWRWDTRCRGTPTEAPLPRPGRRRSPRPRQRSARH